MKNWKLGLILASIIAFTGMANAAGVGYIDYIKVIDNYDYAKKVTKEVDAKGLEMQQYLVDKEKGVIVNLSQSDYTVDLS